MNESGATCTPLRIARRRRRKAKFTSVSDFLIVHSLWASRRSPQAPIESRVSSHAASARRLTFPLLVPRSFLLVLTPPHHSVGHTSFFFHLTLSHNYCPLEWIGFHRHREGGGASGQANTEEQIEVGPLKYGCCSGPGGRMYSSLAQFLPV